MTSSPQNNDEIYKGLDEVYERKEKYGQVATDGRGNTASISSFYVTPLRELHDKEQKIKE